MESENLKVKQSLKSDMTKGIRTYRISTLGNALLGEQNIYVHNLLANAIVDLKSVCTVMSAGGMAANQIGYPIRVCVARMNNGSYLTMINPKITYTGEEFEKQTEFCFSLPGYKGEITRSKSITVEFIDEFGEYKKVACEGQEARHVQHEVDHLNGILISEKGRYGGQTQLVRIRRRFKARGYTYGLTELGEYVA